MAKKSNNELLSSILNELDTIRQEQVKMSLKLSSAQKNASAVDDALASSLTQGKKQHNVATDLLSSIADTIKKYRNVKAKDAEHAAEVIKTLGDSLSSFKYDKNTLDGIQSVANALEALNASFGKMADNFFSTMFRFMPIKGYMMGRRIAKFYKRLIEGFEAEKLDETLKKMRQTFGRSKGMADGITAFGGILSALMEMDKAELLKFGLLFKMMPSSLGEDVNNFIVPIVTAFDHPLFRRKDHRENLPIASQLFADTMGILMSINMSEVSVLYAIAQLGGKGAGQIGDFITIVSSSVGKIKLDEAQLKSFGELMRVLTHVSVAQILTLALFNKLLTPKSGEEMALFYQNFVNRVGGLSQKKIQKATDAIKSITTLVSALALTVATMMVVATLTSWEDMGKGALLLGGVLAITYGVVKVLTSKEFESGLKGSQKSATGIVTLMLGLTAVLAIGVLIANLDGEHIWDGFKILGAVTLMSLGIMWTLSRIQPKVMDNSMKSVKGVLLFIGGLALTLVVLTEVAKTDMSNILGGLGMLTGVLAMTVGLMWMLSSNKIQRMKSQSLKAIAGVLLLIAGLTLTLAVVTEISSKYDWKTLLKGMAVLGGIVAFSLMIMWTLSTDKIKKMEKGSLQTIGGVILLTLSMALIARLYIGIGDDWDKILKGTMAAGAIMLAGLGLIWLGSKMDKKTVGKGLLAVGATILALAGIVLATNYYMDLMDRIHGMDEGSITEGSLVVAAIVGGVGLIMMAAGALLFGPQAAMFALGFAALESISLAIFSISTACMSYTELINKVNHDLTPTKLESATNMLAGDEGGMVGSIKKIVSSLLDIGAWSSIKIAIISKSLFPLFESLGGFVDVISKMANLQMVESYDKDGKPIYKPMSSDDFKNASSVLTEGFTTFLTSLMGAFGVKDGKADPESATNGSLIWKCAQIIFMLNVSGVRTLIVTLGHFVDTISKMANLSIADQWDEHGKPIHFRKIEDKEFIQAAETLSKAFGTFLTTLHDQLKDSEKAEQIEDIIDELTDAGIKPLMVAVSSFASTIQNLASMSVPTEWDKDGKAIKYEKLKNDDFIKAADTVANAFCSFLTTLHKSISEDMADDLNGVIKDLTKDGGILTLFKAINEAMNPIMQIASGKLQVGKDTVSFDDKQCIKAGETIVSVFRALLTPMKEFAGLIEGVEMSTLAEALSMPLPIMRKIADLKPQENKLDVNSEIFGTAVANLFTKLQEVDISGFFEATKGIDYKLLENILLTPYGVVNKISKMEVENLEKNIKAFNQSMESYFSSLQTKVKMNELYDTHKDIEVDKLESILLLPYTALKKVNGYGPVEKELGANILEFTTALDNYIQTYNKANFVEVDNMGKTIDYDQTLKTLLLPLEMFKEIMAFGPLASQLDQNVNLYCLSLSQVIQTARETVNKFTSADAETFNVGMQHLIGNFSTLQTVLKGNPKIYDDAKESMVNLDKAVIDGNQKRIDALKKTQDAFDGVANSVRKLTESIQSLQKEESKLYNAQAQQRIQASSQQVVRTVEQTTSAVQTASTTASQPSTAPSKGTSIDYDLLSKAIAKALMDAMDNDTRPRNYTIGSLQITQKGGKIIDVHSTN